jgi:adenylate cyclase
MTARRSKQSRRPPATAADSLDNIVDWLIDGARSAHLPQAVLQQLCDRLAAIGLPLWRAGVFVRTLHPDVYGRSFVWRQGQEVVVSAAPFAAVDSDDLRKSPLRPVLTGSKIARHKLTVPLPDDIPLLHSMRDEGNTDYVAFPITFSDGELHACSWTTKRDSGFSDADIAALRRVVAALARMAEVWALRRTATNLLNTYVGTRAGARILAGQIRRGQTDLLHAAIWLSDLRGFTAISDRAPSIIVVDLLNRYFDCQVPAIVQAGGEVLKFMGDGLLAIFPIADDGSDEAEICKAALNAAREAREAVRALRYSMLGGPAERVSFGVALHVGDVLYGNIGGADRLDFTCIGPAVNLAARMEKLAGGLGRTVVASPEFAGHAMDEWQDIGEFSVSGFARAQRVFGLRDEAAAASGAEAAAQ